MKNIIIIFACTFCILFCGVVLAQIPGTVKWEYLVGGRFISHKLGPDGSLYIISTDKKLQAFNRDGIKKWEFSKVVFSNSNNGISPLNFGNDGTIYAASINKKIYAINPDGTKKWELLTGSINNDPPTIGSNGTIYIISPDMHKLYAINPDGMVKWEFNFDLDIIYSSPAIGIEGTIYVSTYGGKLYFINSDGVEKWNFISPGAGKICPGSDGTIFLKKIDYTNLKTTLIALTSNGSKKWEFEGEGKTTSLPIVDGDGKVYWGTKKEYYCLNSDGTVMWTLINTSGYYGADPAVGNDGTIYMSSNGQLYAFNSNGVKKWESKSYSPNNDSTPILGSDGNIYVFLNWYLYAFDPNGNEKWHIGSSFMVKNGSLPVVGNDGIIHFFSSAIRLDGTVKFKLALDNYFNGSIAIGIDAIYVRCSDKKLYAFNPDGSKKWEFLTEGQLSSVSVGANGTIYVGSTDKKLYALNSDGTKKWEFLTEGEINSSPAIGIDGAIYFMSSDNKLYAINQDGSKKWEFLTSGVGPSPVIASNGTLYVIYSGGLHAINSDGTKKWDLLIDSSIEHFSPAIGSDGNIYLGSYNGTLKNWLFAIDPTGIKKWEFLMEGRIGSSPVIGSDGTIYICALYVKVDSSENSKLYAINADGTKKWDFVTPGWMRTSPIIGSDGTIYCGTENSFLYAINQNGGKVWEINASTSSDPAIGSDGTIYIGSKKDVSSLLAIYSGSRGLADSPWPKYQKNSQNTGSSEGPFKNYNSFSTNLLNVGQNLFLDLKFTNGNFSSLITGITFNDDRIKTNLSLPIQIGTDKKTFTIPINISNPGSEILKLGFRIAYSMEEREEFLIQYFELATIVDDNSELGVIGKRAINAYQRSIGKNPIAELNNKGVIYRLLGYPDIAKPLFDQAVSSALKNYYGFAGIKINQGVVESDKNRANEAKTIYTNATADISSDEKNSVLTPQIYYNLAWEYFKGKNYNSAENYAIWTINHTKANDFLKAKAYTLLGAIKIGQSKNAEAVEAFKKAIELDNSGPIGKMARENMWITTSSIELSNDNELQIYPQPANDYVVIEFQGNELQKVILELFNIQGEIVYSKKLNPNSGHFYHSIDVNNLPSGTYILKLNSEAKSYSQKLTIQ